MGVSKDDILSRGPVQRTFVDDARAAEGGLDAGVDSVEYGAVANAGAPVNPTGAADVVARGGVNVSAGREPVPRGVSRVTGVGAPKVVQASAVRPPERVSAPEGVADVSEGGGSAASGVMPREGFYTRFFLEHSPDRPKSEKELEDERQRQRRKSMFAAIGDGISAMSNLYFTSQYAPDSFDASKGMAPAVRARFDRLKKEYENSQREFMNGYMRAMAMDAGADKDAVAQTWAAAKAKRDEALFDLDVKLRNNEISRKEAEAEAARIKADYMEEFMQSQINKNNRPTGSGGGRGKAPEYPWYDNRGEKHYAYSYEAMRQNSIDNGTWNEVQQQSYTNSEKKGRNGKIEGSTAKTSTKPAKGHSSNPNSPKDKGKGYGDKGKGY